MATVRIVSWRGELGGEGEVLPEASPRRGYSRPGPKQWQGRQH